MASRSVEHRRIGTADVSPLGLGCAGFSLDHADDEERAERTIIAAIEAGITLLDTALAYTPAGQRNHNERLLRRLLARLPRAQRDRVLVATKGGHYRDGDSFPVDGRPQTLKAHAESSLVSLGVDRIALYHLHWPDPQVPIEESVGTLAELQQKGVIDQIGVSNVDVELLRRAQKTARIASVQNKLNLYDQTSRSVLAHCDATGTAFLAYSPLGGIARARTSPFPTLAKTSSRHGITPAQTALAWLRSLSPNLIPLVGATRHQSLNEAVAAMTVRLTDEEITALSNEH
ncbi:aldo/keto reductase [Streptomyces sp. NPDC004096]